MSNTTQIQPGTSNEESRATPRAVIHRRILDEAESRPRASHPQIAAAVGGASVSLVKRVLNEYGDPGRERNGETSRDRVTEGDQQASTENNQGGSNHAGASNGSPSCSELSIQQQQTLRAIYDHPDATQRDLAEVLGVSAATVCQRMKSIDGFDWADRRAFVSQMFGAGEARPETKPSPTDDTYKAPPLPSGATNSPGPTGTQPTGSTSAVDFAGIDCSLAHKIIHVCVQSEYITWEEERRIIEGLMSPPDGN